MTNGEAGSPIIPAGPSPERILQDGWVYRAADRDGVREYIVLFRGRIITLESDATGLRITRDVRAVFVRGDDFPREPHRSPESPGGER